MKNYAVKFLAVALLMPALLFAVKKDCPATGCIPEKYAQAAGIVAHTLVGGAAGYAQGMFFPEKDAAAVPAAPADKGAADSFDWKKHGRIAASGVVGDQAATKAGKFANQLLGQEADRTEAQKVAAVVAQYVAYGYKTGNWAACSINPLKAVAYAIALKNVASDVKDWATTQYAPVIAADIAAAEAALSSAASQASQLASQASSSASSAGSSFWNFMASQQDEKSKSKK